MLQPNMYSGVLNQRTSVFPSIKLIVLSTLLITFFLISQEAYAVNITLEWDANIESDLAGYRVFARVEGDSFDYNNPDWQGTATTCTINDLDDDTDYYFVVRAYDTAENESVDSNEEHYEAPQNGVPTANAGPNQTVAEGDTVTLNGQNSSDPEGAIASYEWTQTAGASVTLLDSTTATPEFTAPSVGLSGESFTFQLTVTDSGGLSDTDTVIINVSNVNQAPTANAGPDQTVSEGDTVTLNGQNSSDPEGAIASYGWTQTAGTSVTLSGSTTATPQFTAPSVGLSGESFTFQLTVTDSGGLSDTDTVIINVSNVNQAPTANAGPNQTVAEGDTVTLDGRNSSDPDGSIASYQWTQTAGTSVTFSGSATATPWFTSPNVNIAGEALTFQVTVTDDGGLSAADTVIINVSNVNQSPTANAGPDQTVGEGALVTLNGLNSSDPDGSIASYSWVQTVGSNVTLLNPSSAQPSFTTPDVDSEGTSLTFQLTVTDNGGLQATDTCIVNVSWVNIAPTADAGSNQSVNEGVTVSLDGTYSTDPDDGIASYVWTQTAGPSVTLSNPSSATPEFSAPYIGTDSEALTFQLTVTDTGGLSGTDTVIINVSDVNLAPVADAGGDQSVDMGAGTVTLSGVDSYDSDGNIESYSWTQTSGITVTLSNPGAAQPTFTAPAEVGQAGESLTFQLTVTDDGGLQATDTCTIEILWVDLPPAVPTGFGIKD